VVHRKVNAESYTNASRGNDSYSYGPVTLGRRKSKATRIGVRVQRLPDSEVVTKRTQITTLARMPLTPDPLNNTIPNLHSFSHET